MKLQRNVSFNPYWLGLVPLVNVVFLALLFFSLSSSFVLQPGLQIRLPSAPFVLRPQHDPLIATIVPGPVSQIYFRDQRLTLEEFGKQLAGVGKDRTLIIRADQSTPADVLIRASSEGLKNGCSVVLATAEEPHATRDASR